jgi:hypothetical protein
MDPTELSLTFCLPPIDIIFHTIVSGVERNTRGVKPLLLKNNFAFIGFFDSWQNLSVPG